MYSVSISHLSKSFGKTAVLTDISCEIAAGELFFLLGPSGCGKTTLLRIIAGFETPDSGTLAFNGTNALQLPAQKRNASLVFQNYALWPHLTVAQNIAFGLETRKLAKPDIVKKTGEALALVRMEEYAARLPGQLSGGQQQRVALARALVVNPDLLLLDEPLSNLDARLRTDMRLELARLHKRTGVTAVYVTHDQDEALSLADRIGYLDKGRLIQVGTPRELYERPRTTSLARFLGHANIVAGTITDMRGSTITVTTPLGILTGTSPEKATMQTGQTVSCFFRPEQVRIESSGPNTFTGTVTAALYTGSSEQIHCEKNNISCMIEKPAGTIPTAAGTILSCSIAPESILVLAE